MVEIHINNNDKCQLVGDIKIITKLKKAFSRKHPNAFFLRRGGFVQSGWDGNIKYITDANYFKIGLLQDIHTYIKDVLESEVDIRDHRPWTDIIPKIPRKVGDLEVRPYQYKAVRAILRNKVGDITSPIGVLNMATNAGKTLMMAMLYLAYGREIPCVVLIDDGDLFEQFKRELPQLLGDDVGFVRGKEHNWNKFTVCMVQTLSRDIKYFAPQLRKKGIVAVDEADKGNSKSYKNIISHCTNAKVRVGLSGTIYMSKLKKDEVNDMNLKTFFGPTLYTITKKEMAELGHSTKIIARIVRGCTKPKVDDERDWKAEYDRNITYNEDRAMVCVDRIKWNIKFNRLPAMVICQFHKHIELMEMIFQRELGHKYKIAAVHGDTKNRKQILEDFRNGNIDILIASFIVKRGKNFPKTKLLLNAAGSDSQSTIWQLMGRLERTDESKKKAYMEDLFDTGKYMSRHSKHRLNYYRATNFKIIEDYKKYY